MKKAKVEFIRKQTEDKILFLGQYAEYAVALKDLIHKGRYEAAFDLSKTMAELGRHVELIDKCLVAQKEWKKNLIPQDLESLKKLETKAEKAAAVCMDLINTLSCDIKKGMKETAEDLKAFRSNRKKFQSLEKSSGTARILDIQS